MEIVTTIAPIVLALIMLGLGLGLSIKDFTRILRTPKDFIVGFLSQLIVIDRKYERNYIPIIKRFKRVK